MLTQDIEERAMYINTRISEAAMANLRQGTFDSVMQALNEEQKDEEERLNCAVCFADFKDEDEVAVLNCHKRHIYHLACIKEWLRYS